MPYPRHHILVISILLAASCMAADSSAQTGWKDRLGGLLESKQAPTSSGTDALTEQELSTGLQEALMVGSQRAIELLGRDGGFLDDPSVRIPLPKSLESVASGLRMLGQGGVVDELTTTINRAAEAAVPKAATIFGDAIRAMSITDARQILTGPDDAATRYFQNQTGAALSDAMRPVVEQTTEQAGVTRAYKNLTRRAGPAAEVLQTDSLDLDQYITDRALDGLFVKLAEQERLIRANPAARSTEILRKVFGSMQE